MLFGVIFFVLSALFGIFIDKKTESGYNGEEVTTAKRRRV